MTLLIRPDQAFPPTASAEVFSTTEFRAAIADEYHLQAVRVFMGTTGEGVEIPAFLRSSLFGEKTLVIGAGFDKTGVIEGVAGKDYTHTIGQLVETLGTSNIQTLEIRTTQYIPCLTDESDKVELNVDIESTVEAVWNGLSSNTRKNIRRPLKRGFTSVIGKTPKLLDEFYRLYRMSLHDIGSLPHAKHFFTRLLEECADYIEIFVGYMEGIPVVSSISFTSQNEIYGAWSGIHIDYKRHNVFLAMLWQMVEHCGKTGRNTYNLGRSSEGSSQHQFKQKLANRSHKIYYYRIKTAPPHKTRSHLQDAASWLIRHTPEMVMDGLSRSLLHRFY